METKGITYAVVAGMAITAVVIIECVALCKGVNGKILSGSFLIIGALGGLHFDRLRKVIKGML